MIALAHVSDLHATGVRFDRPGEFVSKRFLGWLSWRTRRHAIHRPEVLEALAEDLGAVAPDHVAVTGDLTNVASQAEFPEARRWLERLGTPARVSAVPGNHDAYAAVPHGRGWELWSEYLESDDPLRHPGFPTLRRRGGLALVGVCTAQPTAPFLASGSAGAEQLTRLEGMLAELAESGLCRVVLLHHPVTEHAVSPRRALRDAAALREVLVRSGAELVLHGHGHHQHFATVPGPRRPIPVVGVGSASDVRQAQYHVYGIERSADGFRIQARERAYDPTSGRFVAAGERPL